MRERARKANGRAFGFILVIVLLDALSFGLIFPVLPRLVLVLSGGDAAGASRAFGLIAGVWALMNFLAAPVLGAASDRFGRRPVILVSTFGLSLDLVLMALAPSLAWLFLGRAISGVTSANYATAAAYVADVSGEDKRAARFGLLAAISGVGLVLGPVVGGFLGELSPRTPFWAAAALTGLSCLYGLFVLPESLRRHRRTVVDWSAALPVKSLGILTKYKGLVGLASVMTLLQVVAQAANALLVLYTAHRYGWNSGAVGVLLMVYSVGSIAVMAAIAPLIVKALGDRLVVLLGIACSIAGFFGLALAPSGTWFCVAVGAVCLGSVSGPALTALVTQKVDPGEQGRLHGALGALMALGSFAGPIAFTQIFAWSILSGSSPSKLGAAMAAAGLLMIGAWILAFVFARGPARARQVEVRAALRRDEVAEPQGFDLENPAAHRSSARDDVL